MKKNISLFLLPSFLAISLLFCRSAEAQTTMVISDPKSRYPIAVPQLCLLGGSSNANKAVPEVISRDLDLSGYFDVLNASSYIESPGKCVRPDSGEYGDWSMIRAQWLVRGSVDGFGKNLRVQLYLHDVPGQRSVLGKEYQGTVEDLRMIGHKFANEIMRYVTGELGPFGSRIAFASRIGRFKELFVMDMDGANLRQITRDSSLSQSPSWDPAGRSLAFTSYRSRVPDLFMIDVATGRSRQLTRGPALEVGSDFTKDGQAILSSVAQDRGSDLALLSTSGQIVRRITQPNGSINVSGAFSPDGSEIAFTSDRAGKPQVYLMGADGSNPRRISFVTSDYCTSPAWSPKGDRLAFVCRAEGGFNLFLANNDGSNPIQLTSGGDNEDPSWSPDGRYLAYASTMGRRGGFQIALMRVAKNLEGSSVQALTQTRGDDTDPAWGPLPTQ
jgi:TolB protein